MRMTHWFLALLIAGSLVGCNHTQPDPRVVAFEAGKKQVMLDKRMLEDCPELPKLTGATEKEALAAIEKWTEVYGTCRGWKARLNSVVREAFNIEK